VTNHADVATGVSPAGFRGAPHTEYTLAMFAHSPRGLAALLLVASVAPASSSAADLKQVESRGALRVMVSADESPAFFSFDPATKPGFEREVLEGFARLRRLKLEVVKVAQFDEVIPSIVRDHADVATGIIDTESRRKQVSFTVEILPSRLLLVGRGPRPPRKPGDLGGDRVGSIQGTSWADTAIAAGVSAASIDSFADMPALLAALKARRVSVIVLSLSDYVLLRRADHELRAGPFLGVPRSAAWALRREDQDLRNALNEYIENLRRTPSWGRMAVSYFGDDALALLGRAQRP
jgi:ABC-type amino acid transport substrate-binding protein